MNDKLRAIQTILGVTPDSIWGPRSQAALDALIHPAPVQTPVPVETAAGEAVDSRSEAAIATLLPVVQPLARQLIRNLLAAGITAKIISGSRTYAEQNAIYEQGRSKPGPIVTNARGGQSWHNFAVAVDIGIFENGKYLDDSPLYDKAGAIGQALGFEWGGAWKGNLVDAPHFQYNPNRVTLAQARALHDQGKPIA